MRNHINFPRPVDIKSCTIEMPQACLGAYGLTKAALEKADWWGTANINPNTTLSPDLTAKNGRVVQMETCMGIYIPSGQPPVDQFAIGDMRITYRTVEIPGSNATIVGVQSGSSLRAYTKQDAARTMGRTTPRDNTAEEDFEEMGEQEAKRVQAMLSGEGPSGQKPNCCQIFGFSPLEKSVSGMFFSEQLRIEKVHACAPPQWHSLQMHTNPPLCFLHHC